MNIYVAAVHDIERREYFLLGAYEDKDDAKMALSHYVNGNISISFRAKRKNRAWQAETPRYTLTVELLEVEQTSKTQRIADPIYEQVQHRHTSHGTSLNTIESIYNQ